MATRSVADDATSICSVCLEPYKGRNPKLLPCFHTLCLPCLKDLEEHHMALANSKVCEDDGSKKPLTFPCPTCRTDITVPSGGVSQFQNNFYLSLETLTCDVCGEAKEAKYNCSDCGQNMCSTCQRCHDNFTFNHQIQPLASFQHLSQTSLNQELEGKLEEQLAVLEAALATMREEEETLQREKQAVADVIRRRADAVRAMVTQAEERSQEALADVSDRLGRQIKESIHTLRQKYRKFYRHSPQEGMKGQLNLLLKSVLLSDDDFQYYQQQCSKGRQTRKILHQFKNCAIDMHTMEAYLGTVCEDDQPVGETANSLVSDSVCNKTDATDCSAHDVPVTSQPTPTLTDDVADLRNRLEKLETTAGSQCEHSDLRSIREETAKLQMDVAALKEKIFSIQHTMITTKEISSIQKDMASVQEKQSVDNTMLQKDITTIQEVSSDHNREIKKFQSDFKNLVNDLKSFKEKSCNMVAFHANLTHDIEISEVWQRLILSTDEYNEGQAYDTKTGVFTAPVTGTYFFMARALRTEGLGYCALAIGVEGCNDAISQSHCGTLEAGVGCTVHVVRRLTQGQTVSLFAYGVGTLLDLRTCFSGMLVRPEVELA